MTDQFGWIIALPFGLSITISFTVVIMTMLSIVFLSLYFSDKKILYGLTVVCLIAFMATESWVILAVLLFFLYEVWKMIAKKQ